MIRKISFAFIFIGLLIVGNACSTFVPVPIELTEQAAETAQVETEIAGKVYQIMTLNALETLIVKLSETPIPPTETMTPSPTPLPTSTETPTPTDTFTPTPTDTFTPTPTDTFTPTPTDTFTPTPTDTYTPTPTDTFTPTPTDTFTPMPTDTFTPIPTDTFMPMPTDTFTPIPTDTFTPMATATKTSEPTKLSTRTGAREWGQDKSMPTIEFEPIPTLSALVTEAAPDILAENAEDGYTAEQVETLIAILSPAATDILSESTPSGSEFVTEADVSTETPEFLPVEIESNPLVIEIDESTDGIRITEPNPDKIYRIAVKAEELILILSAADDSALDVNAYDQYGSAMKIFKLSDSEGIIRAESDGTIDVKVNSGDGLELARFNQIDLDIETPTESIRTDPGQSYYVVQIPVGDGVKFEVLFDENAGGEVSFIPWSGEKPERFSGLSQVQWRSCCGLSEYYFVLLDSGLYPAFLRFDWISREGGN